MGAESRATEQCHWSRMVGTLISRIMVLLVLLLAVTSCRSIGGGGESVSDDGLYFFEWVDAGPERVLSVSLVGGDDFVFQSEDLFRRRDRNVAAWVPGENTIVAYSSDLGTFVISEDGGGFEVTQNSDHCLPASVADQIELRNRIVCPVPAGPDPDDAS